ncbi:MAG: hypothetical protein ACJA2S_001058 [Cyclobacteriaceae bacterium]|jgi:hypothetical protein
MPGLYLLCNKHKRAFKKRCPKHSKECSLVFQSKIWNPNSQKTDIIKTWKTDNPEAAFDKHNAFKKELEQNNYYLMPEVLKERKKPTVLKDCVERYLSNIQDEGIPEHEKKDLTARYISDEKTAIDKFLNVLNQNGLKPNLCHVSVNSSVVGLYHEHLETNGFANKSYNN